MKKTVFIVILVIALLITACAQPKDEANGADEASGEVDFSGQTLTVLNWNGYGSDQDYSELVFEEMYNCEVEHVYFTSLDEMLNMLRTGGLGTIDVLLPNSSYLVPAKEEGLIQPVDISKMENYDVLRSDLANVADVFDDEGNIYGVPWAWGTTSLGYNPDATGKEITSWAALWDEEYKGKVGFSDDYYAAIIVAALYLGEEDPYNPDLAAVEQALLDLKKNVKTYWTGYDEFLKPYHTGEIVIGNMWLGMASTLQREGGAFEYVYPEEGTVGWADYWAIAAEAPHYDLAVKWLDFMSSVQFQEAFANDPWGACPANEEVLNSLSDDLKKAFYIYPEPPTDLVMQIALSEETRQEWLELWNRVKAD